MKNQLYLLVNIQNIQFKLLPWWSYLEQYTWDSAPIPPCNETFFFEKAINVLSTIKENEIIKSHSHSKDI